MLMQMQNEPILALKMVKLYLVTDTNVLISDVTKTNDFFQFHLQKWKSDVMKKPPLS